MAGVLKFQPLQPFRTKRKAAAMWFAVRPVKECPALIANMECWTVGGAKLIAPILAAAREEHDGSALMLGFSGAFGNRTKDHEGCSLCFLSFSFWQYVAPGRSCQAEGGARVDVDFSQRCRCPSCRFAHIPYHPRIDYASVVTKQVSSSVVRSLLDTYQESNLSGVYEMHSV